MHEITNKSTALVTGGSRGIGLAIAKHLADLGFSVAITGRNQKHLEAARARLPETARAYAGDVSQPDEVKQVVEQVSKDLGPIDLLVNNAGITGTGGPFLKSDPADWWQVQEVNLRGPMLFMRALLPAMVERGEGTVINIGSLAAIKQLPGNISYCVSKAALARLTDSIASELEGSGVTLFCLSPGLVETDMTRDISLFKDLPADVWSQPEDVCDLISRILNSDCSSINGRFLHVHDDLDTILANAETVSAEGLYKLGMQNLEGRID